ncbi:MAG: SusC/RagA family TonB-linked outer membrane protein [Gemmatimonadaceae bacterium]
MLLAAPAAVAQVGTVTGRVTAVGSSEPLSDARILIVNTSRVATSDVEGRFTVRNVPAGNVDVRVLRVGYQEQKKTVQLSAGGTATVDFTMSQAVILLPDVVTTATGEQRRVELGNAVTALTDVNSKVETTPVSNIADLLVAKAPGVIVLPGAMTGANATIRIRGLSSLATSGSGISNDPIYVIDGVRMAAGTISLGTGGTTASLLNTLDPNEIEDIEIVKGPSAATLYGTDAANGVIVISTKKGHAGATRWTWFGQGEAVSDRNAYSTDYASWGHDPTSNAVKRCTLITESQKTCILDSLTSFNDLTNDSTTPIRLGHRDDYGMNASGGSDAVRFFVSGDLNNELGPLHMPGFAQRTLDSLGTPLRDEWINPEQFQSQSFRVNISAAFSPKFDFNGNAGFSNTNQRLPQVDNNTFSVYYSAWNNPGFNHDGLGYSELQKVDNVAGTQVYRNGYGGFSTAQIFQVVNENQLQRFTGSTDATWRPFAFMQNQGSVGVDLSNDDRFGVCRFNECPNSGTQRQGTVSASQTNLRNLSAKLISTSSWQARSNLSLKTTIGGDYNNLETDGVNSNGSNLPPGAQNVGQAAVKSGGNSLETVNKTLGLYAQEEAAFRDRMFFTVAERTDQNSSFGTKFQNVVYPKAQISWILSDESFFPHPDWLNQFRLRSAYGASGVQPGGTVALQTYSASTANIAGVPGSTASTDTPGLLQSALGNPNLKPERSTEWESGFESNVLQNRVHLDFTYYTKKTRDAIISNPIASSSGASALSVLQNLGSVQNTGVEFGANATVLDRRSLGWDINLSMSHNSNKILNLGIDPSTGKPRTNIGTGTTRDSLGLPVNAWVVRPFTYADANGDGIITPDEVTINSAASAMIYYGYSSPRDIIAITNGLDLFQRHLRLTALFDYKGGYNLNNSGGSFYATNFATWYSENLKDTPLWDQARNVAASSAKNPSTAIGYAENGSYWRLREVSAAWTLPKRVSDRIRSRDAQIVFSARNLHVWTKYTGVDPEANFGSGDVQTTFSTTAPRTYFSLRANLHY